MVVTTFPEKLRHSQPSFLAMATGKALSLLFLSFISTQGEVCMFICLYRKLNLHIEVCTHIHVLTKIYVHQCIYNISELKNPKSKHCAVHTSSHVERMREQEHDSCWLCCLMNHPAALHCLVWYNQHRINCNQIGSTGC